MRKDTAVMTTSTTVCSSINHSDEGEEGVKDDLNCVHEGEEAACSLIFLLKTF